MQALPSLGKRFAKTVARRFPAAATVLDYVGYTFGHSQLLSTPRDLPTHVLEAIRRDGYYVLEGYLSPEKCDGYVAEIDRLIAGHPECVRSVSDERIFGAQELTSEFDAYHRDPFLRLLADQVMCAPTANAFTLANRLIARPGTRGSGEGWHKDHWFRQFKSIVYLTDVGDAHGPFQLLPGSHRLSQYLHDMSAVGLPFRTLAVSDAQVDQLLQTAPDRVRSITAPKGSVILVDTACIHRGKPPTQGVRYALTNYYVERYQISDAFIDRFEPANAAKLRQLRADDQHWYERRSGAMRRRAAQFLRSARTFSFMLRRNPERAMNILSLRIERKTGAPLHFLSSKRIATYAFELLNTRPVDDTLTEYGNYLLDASLIPERPVVFSLGIGRDVRFDHAVIDRHHATLVMVDPTPSSCAFVAGLEFPAGVHFHSVAVGSKDGTLRVYPDELEDSLEATTSVSINPHAFHDKCFEVPCVRVSTLMKEHGVAHIDILKADIEGAAIDVLEDLLVEGIHPTQIAVELERPQRYGEIASYFARISVLFSRLRELGYTLYRTRQMDRGLQIEVLAVRRSTA